MGSAVEEGIGKDLATGNLGVAQDRTGEVADVLAGGDHLGLIANWSRSMLARREFRRWAWKVDRS